MILPVPSMYSTKACSHWLYAEFILASSMLFELAEWLGAVTLAPNFTDSYLGQQGDAWDAHKDMGLAAMGAVLSMLAIAVFLFLKTNSNSAAADRQACE